MQWRLLLGQWPQLGRQHDICEFLAYWLHLSAEMPEPRWEARRFRHDQLCVLGSGSAHLPIPLPICPGDVCHLQWCVDKWHAQSSVRALTSPHLLAAFTLSQ